MASNVSNVYIHVVDDVISKVRDEFINYGVGENVLTELQELWEMKMKQCGAISGTIERPPPAQKPAGPITPVHDLNVPYEGPTEEYETPTAEMLFPPTPLQTPIQTPLPGTDQSMYNIPTGPSDYAPSPITDIRNGVDLKSGRPSPYMQPPSPWMGHRPLGVDVNVAYVEGRDEVDRGASNQPTTQDFFTMSSGKRKRDDYPSQLASGGYMPQQDGSGDVIEFILPQNQAGVGKSMTARGRDTAIKILSKKETKTAPVLPQQDGVHDEYDDLFHFQGVANEDYNTPAEHVELRAPTPAVGTPKPAKNEAAEDDEPPLNEDDDDEEDLDDLEHGEEEPSTQHLVLAQFDKVTRTKSRWKCALKDGIMHLNNRDILFNKATGEFDF
ncbi:transcription initiation factor IIA large subunit isoform X1 [Elaeis guineensis]|uniref:Transcription initiation factor IIA subunit 1 isoform X1 n=1 Tax=Elaeis guineensis var. tenera TaxID=51953 RepID=A0A6I9R4X9_ELAGV|nr:transcription initiation factor IIA subunit 1 isoform X1 [Elaeis guineensis]